MIQKNVTVEVYCLFGFNGMSSVMQTAPTFKKKITKKNKKNPNIFYDFYFYATLAPDILMIVVTYEVFFSSALIIDLDNLIFL